MNDAGIQIDDSPTLGTPWRLIPWTGPAAVFVCLMLGGLGMVLKPRPLSFAPAQTIEVQLVELAPALPAPVGAGPATAVPATARAEPPPVQKKKQIRPRRRPVPKLVRAKPSAPIVQPPIARASEPAPKPAVASLSLSTAPAIPAPVKGNSAAGAGGSGVTGGTSSGGGGSSAAIFDADYLHNPPPEYPVIALRMGVQGEVLLRVLVSTQGEAEKVELARGSGSSALDNAAMKAVARWRFIAARRGGTPVESWVEVPIRFRLTGP